MTLKSCECFTGADKEPVRENFEVTVCSYPGDPENGEVTIQTLFLSLDPATVRHSDVSYAFKRNCS